MKKLTHISILIFLLSTMYTPVVSVNAQVLGPSDRATYTLLEPLPCVPTSERTCNPGDTIEKFTVDQYIEYVFKFLIAAAVFLSIVMIIVGGFQYMLSEAFTSKTAAKERITNAVLGLLAALASYLILATIDPRLVQINTQIQPITVGGCKYDAAAKEIKCDETNKFYNSIGEDFKKLAVGAQQQANAKIGEKKIIEDQLKKMEEEGFDEDDEEAMNRYYDLVDQLNSKEIEIQKYVANVEGKAAFGRVVDLIYNPDKSDKTASADLGISINKEAMEDFYNRRIERVKATTGGAEEAQKLEKERDFYSTQIEEEKALAPMLRTHGTSGGVKPLDHSTFLLAKKKEYENELSNPVKISGTNIAKEEYTDLLNKRISNINTALKK